VFTFASVGDVGIALIAIQAPAAVSWAVGGLHTHTAAADALAVVMSVRG